MAKLEIHQFEAFSDNYGYLIHDAEAGVTAAIDTPDTPKILAALDETGWQLTHILNTHHHPDHAGGNKELKEKFGVEIIGPQAEASKIPGIDRAVADGDTVDFGGHVARVLDVPGHTLGHIAFHFADDSAAFVGDALFALGCGRVFEGTPPQMWNSLQKIAALPPETVIHCAHEYTQANARFAETIETSNEQLMSRVKDIDDKRARGERTVPMTLEIELATNPFLRAGEASLQRDIGMEGADPAAVFTEVRTRKDNF